MLVDGLDLVFDLKRSQGAYIYDSRNGRRFLDFFSFFATQPVGLNHPKLLEPAFREKMAEVAINNPSNSDVYTVEMAEFVDTFDRVAIPEELPHLFLVAGGSVAVENALKTDTQVEASASQDPWAMAQQAVVIGNDILNGKRPADPMVLIPSTLITRDNVTGYKGWSSPR